MIGIDSVVKSWWVDIRGKVIVVLLILWIASLVNHFQIYLVTNVLIAVAATTILKPSLSSVITGLLIGLIFDPMAGTFPLLAACILAIVGKQRHVFNPTAFGILISSLIFNRPVAWWGAAWGIIPVVIIAFGMIPVLWKLRRLSMSLSFLIIYFFINPRLTIDGTVFLFAFVMLPEPKTALLKWSWKWGVLVGAFVLVQNLLGIAFADPLLLALLVANSIGFLFTRSQLDKHR